MNKPSPKSKANLHSQHVDVIQHNHDQDGIDWRGCDGPNLKRIELRFNDCAKPVQEKRHHEDVAKFFLKENPMPFLLSANEAATSHRKRVKTFVEKI
jgi:hypothetical protein